MDHHPEEVDTVEVNMTRFQQLLYDQLSSDGVVSSKFAGSLCPEEENCDDYVFSEQDWQTYWDVSGNPLEQYPRSIRDGHKNKDNIIEPTNL